MVLIVSKLRVWRREVRPMKKWRIYIPLLILTDIILYMLYIICGSTTLVQIIFVYMRTIVTIALSIYSFKKIQKATRSSLCT